MTPISLWQRVNGVGPRGAKGKVVFLCAAGLLILYVGVYFAFRQTHIEVWGKNGHPYVIFPEGNKALWYFFRPITYLDDACTGIGFHIGPHQEAGG